MNEVTYRWKSLPRGQNVGVHRLIDEYSLWSTDLFPYGTCKVRIWQSENDTFYAYINLAFRDSANGTVDGTCGMGSTPADAFDKLMHNFIDLLERFEKKLGRSLEPDDYQYSDPNDF